MRIKPNLFWYVVSFLLLVHVQLNLHQFAFFVGGSFILGLFPIKGMRWWKFALLELAALAACLLLNFPENQTLEMISAISGFSGPLLIGITIIFSTITTTLCAQTVYQIVTKTVFKKYLRLT
ncbi:MAG: hypothetical protein Q8J69_01465 [Sphingobacteriaceae bacterium]|nr:hypothetical protein [Sphingobacteriaceae bacterium]